MLTPLAVAGPVAAADSAPGGQTPDGGQSTSAARGVHTVTLITGDVVTVHTPGGSGQAGGTVSVTGPDGRPSRASVLTSGGDLYVYPESAVPYLSDGVLDHRLFDVTGLIADGYDDAHRDSLPLIVSYKQEAAGLRANVAQAAPAGSSTVRALKSVDGAALSESRDRARDFWSAVTGLSSGSGGSSSFAPHDATPTLRNGIAHIWLDGKVHADLAESTAQIGAPQVWAGGDTGQGVNVAVLDTGIDTSHPDLADRIADTRSFVPGEDIEDGNGHGTHVASIVAGTGAASGGTERGVAPGARLDVGKVLSNSGTGADSDVLAGMEWAALDEHAKIINMSLGDSVPSDGSDPLSQAVDQLSAQTGALFVIAAGNTSGASTVSSPGAADAALTVGAVDGDDNLAFFSSQGPRVGDGGLKPEVTAPGVDILAARSQYAPDGEGYYATHSGTSMAAPHVAGAAALLAASHPDLTGAQLKDLLASTTDRTPSYSEFAAGSGRVDVAAAQKAGIFASATAYAGEDESGPVQRPVTYTNVTDAPVVLSLSLDAQGVPAGVFGLSADHVTVPAHGTAQVTLTIDPTASTGASGSFSGQILADAPDGHLDAHTAISLGAITHKMTIAAKDANGDPTTASVALLREGDPDPSLIFIDGSATFYLPDDHYSVLALKDVPGVHGPDSLGMALLGDPDVTFDKDMTITLDAGDVRRVDETTPQPTDATYLRLEYHRKLGTADFQDFAISDTTYDSLWVQPQEKITHGDFYLAARWRKEQPGLTLSVQGEAYTDVLRQQGITALPDGTRTLPLVFAGNGAASDYDGLDARGKAVVVRRNTSVSAVDQASAAAAAGARLLLVANDQPGRAVLSFGSDWLHPAPIDVGLLSRDEGERLIAQAQGQHPMATVGSHPTPSYLYDLMHTWHNDVPSNTVVRASKQNLARIDENFDSPDPTATGEEFRYDFPVYSEWGIGNDVPLKADSRRTDWVTTDGANTWGQDAVVDGLLYETGPQRTYHAGSVQSEEWFKPIERPYLNNNYLGPTRTGNQFRIDVPGYGDADHVGSSQDRQRSSQTVSVYQGDTRIAQSSNGLVISPVLSSADPRPYRIVVQNTRDASFSPYSSSTTTEWDFTSAAPAVAGERDLLPLLQVGYDIAPDDSGRVAGTATFGVTVQQRDPVPVGLVNVAVAGGGTPGNPHVEVSYDDGSTWRTLTADRHGRYRLSAPRTATFASLRVTARDSAGNSVDQTVIRAVGLR